MDITQEKIRPSILNFPHALYRAFLHPHQSLPSYLDLVNHRNIALLQLHTQSISLLRFKIFLRLWELVRFFPVIMRSVTHIRQTLCPNILTRLRMDKRQRMLTDMLAGHHSATSALVSNWRFFCGQRGDKQVLSSYLAVSCRLQVFVWFPGSE